MLEVDQEEDMSNVDKNIGSVVILFSISCGLYIAYSYKVAKGTGGRVLFIVYYSQGDITMDNLVMVGLSVLLTYLVLGDISKSIPLGLVLFLVLKFTVLRKEEQGNLATQAERLARKDRD